MTLTTARPIPPQRWLIVPALAVMAATFLFSLPFKPFGFYLPEPVFALPVVFAWALIRPSVLAPFLTVGLGCYLDLLWGTHLGLWGTSLLVVYGLVSTARQVVSGQGESARKWWYFGACAVMMLTGLIISMALYDIHADQISIPNMMAVGWQFLATAMLYIPANLMIDRFEDIDVRFR